MEPAFVPQVDHHLDNVVDQDGGKTKEAQRSGYKNNRVFSDVHVLSSQPE